MNNIINSICTRANPPLSGGHKEILYNISNPTLSRANPPLSGEHKEILYNISNPTLSRANPPLSGGHKEILYNISNPTLSRANPPLSGGHKEILYNISNPTFARANPPFKGGRGDFYKIKTIINNISNPTLSRANPPFKGKCDLAFATDHQKWRLATQILNGRFVGDFYKIKTIINNISNPTFTRANPPFKGKCDLAFATDHQKWRLATQIFKWEVCGGFL